jgi:hypothetical protein
MTVLLAVKDKPSPSEEAVRKDSAVHVSLSSDSLFKQPGSLAASTSRRTGKPTNLEPPSLIGGHSSLKVRSFKGRAIEPVSGRRAVWVVYMG